MAQLWFPALILFACVAINFSALKAAGESRPDHPLVERRSTESRKHFAAATLVYAVALGVLLVKVNAWPWSASLALLGMLLTLVGWHGSKK